MKNLISGKFATLLVLILVAACSQQTATTPDSQISPTSPPSPTAASIPTEADAEPSDKRGGTLTFASPAMMESLEPQQGGTGEVNRILLSMFERLAERDEQGELIGALAESWDISDDGTEYTFHIRQGVTFQNGEVLTAEAVKFSIERVQNPDTNNRYAERLAGIVDMEVVDENTLKVSLNAPDPLFIEVLRTALFVVSPRAVAESEETGTELIELGAGTGPFMFSEFKAGQEIIVTRYDDYWQGTPLLDSVVFRKIVDSATRLIELQAGTVDFITVDPKDVARLEEEGNTIFKRAGYQQDYYTLNLSDPILSDVLVRRAMNFAIDREALVRVEYYGLAQVSDGGVPPESWGYNADIEGYPYDPEMAAELLNEAGWLLGEGDEIRMKDGEPLILDLPTPDYRQRLAEIIQGQLLKVGIQADLRLVDEAAFWDGVRLGDYDLGYWVRNVGHPDPGGYFIYFHSDEHWFNSQVPIPEVEALLEVGEVTVDRAARKAIYDKVQKLIFDNAYVMWLVHAQEPFAARAEAKDIIFPADAQFRLWKAYIEG